MADDTKRTLFQATSTAYPGSVAGWSVRACLGGGWRWSAFRGPSVIFGFAKSEAAAQERARAAEVRLLENTMKVPHPPGEAA